METTIISPVPSNGPIGPSVSNMVWTAIIVFGVMLAMEKDLFGIRKVLGLEPKEPR